MTGLLVGALVLAGPQGAGAPEGFPRFEFPSHPAEADLLSRFLWFHYSRRQPGGLDLVLFNKEYLAVSDLWMGGAMDRAGQRSAQDWARDSLLAMRLEPEGYVFTHQHFSHAHDHGWPFPLWTQIPGGTKGITAGWHFQESGPGWVWDNLRAAKDTQHGGPGALARWELADVRSDGIQGTTWKLVTTGPHATLTTPEGEEIDAGNAPFLQLRWTRTGKPATGTLPWVAWMRAEDTTWSPERRVYLDVPDGTTDPTDHTYHSMVTMHTHPLWRGKISRMRLCLAPGEAGVELRLDSFFTCYDTRHSANNPIFILASWLYARWTGDVSFLRANIGRMREALRYQRETMGGREHRFIRNPWVGHDGRPGFTLGPDGTKTGHPGRGIGNNYWDLLPFGGDDMYATSEYYASTIAMAEVEEAIRAHPEWQVALGPLAFDPAELRAHAAAVKATANARFWDRENERFVGWIDADGVPHDYGFTFVNLEAIWYGIASPEHARDVLSWVSGRREVAGDTSVGEDIYRWRFGPRATTKRNVDCYFWGWWAPESIPWGGQVQDGGAVLGFSFFDLWARLRYYGADSAWQRLSALLDWERDVEAGGGYRDYYKDGSKGTTLQGGGTAGGIGVDCEFYESSLVPSIVVYGFMGLEPTMEGLRISPKLPLRCPEMGVRDLVYRGVPMNVRASNHEVTVELLADPVSPLPMVFEGEWELGGVRGSEFALDRAGEYVFRRDR